MSTQASEINVGERTQEFAHQVKQTARGADNEEELRIGMESAIRELAADLHIDVDPENERMVLSGGRPDAVYGDLIIEYKHPEHPGQWEEEALYGRDESDSGLIDYMYDIATERASDESELEVILDRMVGIGTNGYKIFFCRYRPKKRIVPIDERQATVSGGLSREDVTGAVELVDVYDIENGARAFLTYLRSLSRKPLTSEKLASSFGPDGEVAQEAVRTMYQSLQTALGEDHPRVVTLYEEWERVFGIVYGEEMGQIRDDRQDFGNVYGVEDPDVKPLLFAVHTYYGLLMKMLVTELLAVVREAPIEESGLYEPNDTALEQKLHEMETGEQYERAGLSGFFEEGFFGWYLDTWDEVLAEQIRNMAEEMTTFEPATPTIKPEVVRDILKDLYQDLVPRVIRHDLGEYLTPDWLAEIVIEEAGYDAGSRMLDPACGSGTFLVEAIEKIRYDSEAEGEELLDQILNNVVGFDLNPVSVIAARTNYLMGLGELAFHSSRVRIPVYQCDSILTPTKYVDVRSMGDGSEGQGYKIGTEKQEFSIPALDDQARIERLLSLVGEYVEMGASSDDFLTALHERLDVGENWDHMVGEFYEQILALEEANEDGVWTELLRNRLAPEFVEDFDFVIGNPPWVGWEHLSDEYRDVTKNLWNEYGLFTLTGTQARMGGGKKDLSMLFTYVAMDEYLRDGGTLAFLITQSVFQSPQTGEGFRRFQLGSDEKLKVVSAHDMVDLQPFEGASNRTGLIVLEKGNETEYPVNYHTWSKTERGGFDRTMSLSEVRDRTKVMQQDAIPINETDDRSPWIIGDEDVLAGLRQAIGESPYTAQAGSCTWMNGVYWIEILERTNGELRIQNLPGTGRKDIPQRDAFIEPDYVYPLVRGRQVGEFRFDSNLYLLMVQDPETRKGVEEGELQVYAPKTYQFLSKFETALRGRAGYKRYFDEDDAFYSIYNVDTNTVKPYKVVWGEQASRFESAVLSPVTDEFLGETPVIPDHKAMMVGFDDKEEAHYLCAVLNSTISRMVVENYTVSTSVNTHVLDNVRIPPFDSDVESHRALAELSKNAHEGGEDIDGIKEEIDGYTADMWDISAETLSLIRDEY